MSKSVSLTTIVCLALLAGVFAQSGTVDCDFRNQDSLCFKMLPLCKRYSYAPDAKNPGKHVFTCEHCDFGYGVIRGGVGNTLLNEFDQVPDFSQTSQTSLQLCQRVEAVDPIYCSHPVCKAELPYCRRYTLTNLREEEVEDGSFARAGHFECVECEDMFEPYKEFADELILDGRPKYLCRRKMEARECGENCQSEFPGCQFYSTSKPEFREDEIQSVEFAQFLCKTPLNGYSPNMIAQKFHTHTNRVKEITVRNYQSGLIECNDLKCKHVFPNCKSFYWIMHDGQISTYYCKQCRDGYKPISEGKEGEDFNLMYNKKEEIELCMIQESYDITLDKDWRSEVPGCKRLRISNVGVTPSGKEVASYKCLQCDDGLEEFVDEYPTEVRPGFELAENFKIRCRPKATPEPKQCDDECKKKLRFCDAYTAIYEEGYPSYALKYTCTTCQPGFVATHDPDLSPWFHSNERHVCKRNPTPEVIDCPEMCKQNFPGCDKIEITIDQGGHNTYRCAQCAAGMYPINYEDSSKGYLSKLTNIMRAYNTIFLCSDNADEVYMYKVDCTEEEVSLFDPPACHALVNCKTGVKALNLRTGSQYYKCVDCPSGWSLKSQVPHVYDIDQSRCTRAQVSTPANRLFKRATTA